MKQRHHQQWGVVPSSHNSIISVKKRSSLHNPQASADNMNETINHHCTWKDISSAHDQEDNGHWASWGLPIWLLGMPGLIIRYSLC
jgi:hypothetical protein